MAFHQAMTRLRLRILLMLVLCLSAAFAAWSWFRPYSWHSDPAARCRVVAAQLKKDRSFYWLDLHLRVRPGESHDLMKPVRLMTADGREIEPADTTLGGVAGEGTTELWFKFWLESADLRGPLQLKINDGSLQVRTGSGEPRLGRSDAEIFPSSRW